MLSLINFDETLRSTGFTVEVNEGPWEEPMLTAARQTKRGVERVWVTLMSPWINMRTVDSPWGERVPAHFDERLYSWVWQCDGHGTRSGVWPGSLADFLKETR